VSRGKAYLQLLLKAGKVRKTESSINSIQESAVKLCQAPGCFTKFSENNIIALEKSA
jgi:hypothetical protein